MQRTQGVDEASCAAALARSGLSDSDMSGLYDALSGTVYGLALTLCETPDVAEKVCAQVFVHLYRHQGEYDAARMTVIQWATQLTHRFALLLAADERAVEQRSGDLLDAQLQGSGLSSAQCHDLAQAYAGGLTYLEIARRRGTDPDQVIRTLCTALHGLSSRQPTTS